MWHGVARCEIKANPVRRSTEFNSNSAHHSTIRLGLAQIERWFSAVKINVFSEAFKFIPCCFIQEYLNFAV